MGSVALHGQPVREFSSHSIGDSSNIWVIWLFVGHQGQLGLEHFLSVAAGVRVDKCRCHQVSLDRDFGRTISLESRCCLLAIAGAATNVTVAVQVLFPLRTTDS